DHSFEAWIQTSQTGISAPFLWSAGAVILEGRSWPDDIPWAWSFGLTAGKVSVGGGIAAPAQAQNLQSTSTVNDGNWHHVAGVVSGNTITFYVDGNPNGTATFTLAATNHSVGQTANNTELGIGVRGRDAGAQDSNWFSGLIDELRISGYARSAAWIKTEYNNQSAPGTFVTEGAQESNSAGGLSVTVASSPAGLALTVDAAPCTAPCTYSWTAGSVHTVAASTQSGATGTQYLFANWSDSGAASHSITAAASTTYTASFTTQYFLTTAVSPSGAGTITPSSGWYNAGTVVPVSAAAANASFSFTGFANPY